MKQKYVSAIRIICSIIFFALLCVVTAHAQTANSEYLYVGHSDTGMLTVVDTNSNLMVNSSPITSNIQGLVSSPAGDYLIASDWDNLQVLFIQPLTNIVLFKVPVNGAPYGLTVSNDGKTVYAALYYEADDSPGNHVAVIDVPSKSVIHYIDLRTDGISPNARMPRKVLLNKDNSILYVLKDNASVGYSKIESYNTVTYALINEQSVWNNSVDMILSPDEDFVYVVSNYNNFGVNGTIRTLNSVDLTVLDDITIDKFPYSIAFNKAGNAYYVTSANAAGGAQYIIKYNYPANTVNARINVPVDTTNNQDFPFKIAVSNMGNIYAGHGIRISVYDPNTNVNIANLLPNHGQPYHMAFIIPSREAFSNYLVQFRTVTAYNTISVSGINVSVYNQDNKFLFSGVTGDGGSVAFYMIPSVKYNILFNQSPNINQWYNLTPSQSSYLVSIPFDQVVGLSSWSNVILPDTASSVARYTIDHPFNSSTGAGWMNSSYSDDSGLSSSVGFFLYKNGSVVGDTSVLVTSSLDSSAPFMCNFSIANAAGGSYQIEIRANQTSGSQYTYSYGLGYTFPGAKWLAGILPPAWYFWIAFGIVLIFFSVGTISKKGLFGIFGAVAGFMFTIAGWFSLYLPDAAALSAVGVIFILSILMFFVEREKYT